MATPAELYAQAAAAFNAGRRDDSRRLLDQLFAADPRHAAGWNLAGILAQTARDFAGARTCFQRAVAGGGSAGLWVNLGFAHQKLGEDAQALAAYTQAINREPRLALAWQKLGGLKEAQGRTKEALDCYRRAVKLDPDDLKSLGDGLYLRRHLADWAPDPVLNAENLLATFARAPRSDFSPGLLLSLPEADAAAQRESARKFARSQWGTALAAPPLAPAARTTDGPLRVGYLSADFCNHAVSFLVSEVIAAHDRSRVKVFAYAYRAPAPGDPWRAAIERGVDVFADIDALDDRAAAQRIRDDGIDVLVDLTGYTGHGRVGINAWRPAPVIAQWIGYIGTLGEPRLADYVIADDFVLPPALEGGFSEAVARMPGCFQPNGRLVPLPAPPTRAAAGLPENGVVFCSFNQAYKFNAPLWDDWCAVLRGVPGSVLWLVAPKDPATADNLRAEAARRGVAPERLVFAPPLPREAHLSRLALADLALDTHPYNSGTTASDALRMGVPVLTWPGESFVSRMAASLLHAAGLPEAVANDRAGLVAMATQLGNDATTRDALRARLQASLAEGRLFQPERFARDLERLYAAMHAQAMGGTRDSFDLKADESSQ